MRRLVLVLTLATCATIEAQSQRPSPRPTVERQQPQQQPERVENQPAPDKRGTTESPLVIQTTQTDKQAADEKAKREDESSANWWMVGLTGVIGVMTIAQIFFSWLQASRLKETIIKMDEIAGTQNDEMRASIAEATRSARAMERIAESITVQAESLKSSIAISREIAESNMRAVELNRPFLELQNGRIEVLSDRSMAAYESTIPPKIQFVFDVHNFGNTPARLDTVTRCVETTMEGAGRDKRVDNDDSPGMMIPPGGDYVLRIYLGNLTLADAQAIAAGKTLFFHMTGTMVYMDQFGHTRRKRYGWICQYGGIHSTLFHTIDFPGYNDEEAWGERPGQEPSDQPRS